jgi:hypothetical protein
MSMRPRRASRLLFGRALAAALQQCCHKIDFLKENHYHLHLTDRPIGSQPSDSSATSVDPVAD